MSKKKKSLIGYSDKDWLRRFQFEPSYYSSVSTPRVWRGKSHLKNPKKVRITIEEI